MVVSRVRAKFKARWGVVEVLLDAHAGACTGVDVDVLDAEDHEYATEFEALSSPGVPGTELMRSMAVAWWCLIVRRTVFRIVGRLFEGINESHHAGYTTADSTNEDVKSELRMGTRGLTGGSEWSKLSPGDVESVHSPRSPGYPSLKEGSTLLLRRKLACSYTW